MIKSIDSRKFILIKPLSTQRIVVNKSSVTKDDFPSSLPIIKGVVRHIPTRRARFKIVVRKVERPFNPDF
ncbi:MAG: hypothetical protein WCX66_04220, partial [archaeon]